MILLNLNAERCPAIFTGKPWLKDYEPWFEGYDIFVTHRPPNQYQCCYAKDHSGNHGSYGTIINKQPKHNDK